MRMVVLVAILILGSAVSDARAQPAVGAVVGASHQAEGTNDLPQLGPPIGGTTVALVALIDWPVTRLVSVGGETSVSGSLSADQSQRTSTSTYAFTSHHRDSVFSGVLKVGTPIDRRLHVAAAAGAGLAYRRTARDGTIAPLFPPSTRSPYSDVLTSYVFAYTLGGDVDFRVAARLRLLAVARWHRLRDADLASDGAVRRGVSSTVVRAGVGLTYRF